MSRGRAERERDRQTDRIWSRLQAPSCQYRAWCGAPTHEPWDHDLSQSQMLNWQSHPSTPWIFFYICINAFISCFWMDSYLITLWVSLSPYYIILILSLITVNISWNTGVTRIACMIVLCFFYPNYDLEKFSSLTVNVILIHWKYQLNAMEIKKKIAWG